MSRFYFTIKATSIVAFITDTLNNKYIWYSIISINPLCIIMLLGYEGFNNALRFLRYVIICCQEFIIAFHSAYRKSSVSSQVCLIGNIGRNIGKM